MDFKIVLKKLLAAFEEQQVRYALMGGFAMGLWGVSRATVDLDFLVHREDMTRVSDIMRPMGYECRYHTENVSQYASPLGIMGGVDFLHAFREASLGMLERAVEKEIFGGTMKVRTLIPEDIIGFKLQAIYNNPQRRTVDRADIEMLVALHRDRLDGDLLRRYFALFEMDDYYRELFGGEEK